MILSEEAFKRIMGTAKDFPDQPPLTPDIIREFIADNPEEVDPSPEMLAILKEMGIDWRGPAPPATSA